MIEIGIGTFDGLDGEMVLLEGRMYQVKADGKVYEPDVSVKTPFATVRHFRRVVVARTLEKYCSAEVETTLLTPGEPWILLER